MKERMKRDIVWRKKERKKENLIVKTMKERKKERKINS